MSLITNTTQNAYEVFNPISRKKESFQFEQNSASMDAAQRKMQSRILEIEFQAKNMLGHPLTPLEASTGQTIAARDSRGFMEKQSDAQWQPVLKAQNPLEQQLIAAQEQVAIEEANEAIKSMTRAQRMAHDIEQKLERESGVELDAKEQAQHLEKESKTLNMLDSLIHQENWSSNSDEAFRVLLTQARDQVACKGGCRIAKQELLRAVDDHRQGVRDAKSAELKNQSILLGEQLAKNEAALESLSEAGDE